MVSSMSRRSICASMSTLRKVTNVPRLERWLIGVQTVQHHLEASVHERCFNHLVIGGARVRLQDDRQSQLCGSSGRVPPLAWPVEGLQFAVRNDS
jgi:hypothetical protein